MFRPVQNPDDEEVEGRVRTRTRTKELVRRSSFVLFSLRSRFYGTLFRRLPSLDGPLKRFVSLFFGRPIRTRAIGRPNRTAPTTVRNRKWNGAPVTANRRARPATVRRRRRRRRTRRYHRRRDALLSARPSHRLCLRWLVRRTRAPAEAKSSRWWRVRAKGTSGGTGSCPYRNTSRRTRMNAGLAKRKRKTKTIPR